METLPDRSYLKLPSKINHLVSATPRHKVRLAGMQVSGGRGSPQVSTVLSGHGRPPRGGGEISRCCYGNTLWCEHVCTSEGVSLLRALVLSTAWFDVLRSP